MSWAKELLETYENCVGKDPDLLPIYHNKKAISNSPSVIVKIDESGKFKAIDEFDLDLNKHIICPVTSSSAGRTSSIAPHGLFDTLIYLAKDINLISDKDNKKHHKIYMEQLSDWCNSEYSHPKVCSVLKYLKKGRLVSDMKKSEFVFNDKDKLKVFVFFLVFSDSNETKLWEDISVRKSWENYQSSLGEKEKAFCMISGECQKKNDNFPRGFIRKLFGSTQAKLFSSNYNDDFTYLGSRFSKTKKPDCLFSIGEATAFRVCNMLERLSDKQGIVFSPEGPLILAWSSTGEAIPPIDSDSPNLMGLNLEDPTDNLPDTSEDFAKRLNLKMKGYQAALPPDKNINVIFISLLTDQKYSISYYNMIRNSDYINRIKEWHKKCSWRFFIGNGRRFFGAPAISKVIDTAIGIQPGEKISSSKKKLKNKMFSLIVQNMIEGKDFPEDILKKCVLRCFKRMGQSRFEWQKNVSITCAIYKYHKKNEKEYEMNLDTTKTSRDYLYGRLVAWANRVESVVSNSSEKITNAEKLLSKIRTKPSLTFFHVLRPKILPYLNKLKVKDFGYYTILKKQYSEIIRLFKEIDLESNEPTGGEFFLGYDLQEMEYYKKSEKKSSESEQGGEKE